MQRFALTMTSKGQVTLPAEYRRSIGVGPGDRLALLLDDEGRATLTKASGDLSSMPVIARRARGAGAVREEGSDPIGDYLVADDARTKSRP